MDYYEALAKDTDFHMWHTFLPLEPQYTRYAETAPCVIAAARKIVDVYRAYADARAAFMYANEKNFGDLEGGTEESHTFVKAFFLKSALLHYGMCVDLCWQVVWAYINSDSLSCLLQGDYVTIEAGCCWDELKRKIKVMTGNPVIERLWEHIKNLNGDTDIKKLTTQYKIMKHRGTLRIKGIDDDREVTTIHCFEKEIDTDIRPEYEISDIESLLYKYHTRFFKYFTLLIDDIIPDDYFNNKIELAEYRAISSKIRKELHL